MISDYLDRDYVLAEARAQRDWLVKLLERVNKKDKDALADLKQHSVSRDELSRAIAALDDSLARAEQDKRRPPGTVYIPSDPVTCGLQAGLTRQAMEAGLVQVNDATPATASASRGPMKKSSVAKRTGAKRRGSANGVIDTSPALRLRSRAAKPPKGLRGKAAFVEGSPLAGGDARYGLDGFTAKFGNLFTSRRAFNNNPARVALSTRPLTMFLFGDWGTGLPLATEVTKRIGEQLTALDASRQPHVIHLGDVYYVGEPDEYRQRVLPYWPVTSARRDAIGSWSLNGNHDMYSSGHGYFDTLLRQDYFLRWHGDKKGNPSSFFLIEDANWQVFGLDTSWQLPSLSSALFGKPTLKDYGGQNGVLTQEQVDWMAKQRNPAKGCILLTHHQPASSRTSETQHADEAVAMLKAARVYSQIDAWFWGHEHRCVVFKPKSQRANPRLAAAPSFCACLGNGGVPVTTKNFEAQHKIADVLWEEDRLDSTSPVYEGLRIVPFGFGRIDTKPGEFEFKVYDHAGQQRFGCLVKRASSTAPTRSVRRGTAKTKTAKSKTAKSKVKRS